MKYLILILILISVKLLNYSHLNNFCHKCWIVAVILNYFGK